ncbi:hypothetical protein DERP_011981 [Dermatophagoides pteronyssinus]|uniref:Uncharacterized protein n=1 Tax=Dermatophagoides pteronyssinus TaxID=6956 RepID=A0ABQ8IVJ2_DERPT|nr:hypothetical protein DERP_011981 [Dermatophagoides pteronyssinus]
MNGKLQRKNIFVYNHISNQTNRNFGTELPILSELVAAGIDRPKPDCRSILYSKLSFAHTNFACDNVANSLQGPRIDMGKYFEHVLPIPN